MPAKTQLIKIRQSFGKDRLPDVEKSLIEELQRLGDTKKSGNKIAIAVGSRGITNLKLMVKTTVDFVKKCGAEPFIVPAMGSHGGAYAEGQKEVLEGYGITEEAVGAPIRSSMETAEIAYMGIDNCVFMDLNAFKSDGVILINRIKPHTAFHGTYESGLVKMCVVGLGKHAQAQEIHSHGIYGLKELMPAVAEKIFARGKILAGIAVVENAYKETMALRMLKADEIMKEEPALLELARENMAKLPVDDIDVLICDRIGKDISGAGLDPNIIGRIKIHGQEEPKTPRIKAIILADLTEESQGDAHGMGLADVICRRLYDKIHFGITYENAITCTFLERSKVPIIAESDKKALDIALRSCGAIEEGREKIIRIRDTLHLDEIYVSQAVLEEISGREGVEIIGGFVEMFDDNEDMRGV